jgi:hypothetical protein
MVIDLEPCAASKSTRRSAARRAAVAGYAMGRVGFERRKTREGEAPRSLGCVCAHDVQPVPWRRDSTVRPMHRGSEVRGTSLLLAVAVLVTACGSRRDGAALSKSDPTAYSALREAISNDASHESRLFTKASRCAALQGQSVRFSNCQYDIEQTTSGWIGETSLVVGLIDESEATPECRAAIKRLRTEEDNFTPVPTLGLEEALFELPAKAALERMRGMWLSVKAARRNALYQCR